MYKICSKCGESKPRDRFYRDKTKTDGLRSHCKNCVNTYNQQEQVLQYRIAATKRFRTDKSHDREYCKRYRHSDHGRVVRQQQTRRYRERKQLLDLKLSLQDIEIIYNRFSHQCFNCGSVDCLSIDHHRPLSLGFGLTINNAVLLCRSCNATKHDKMPEDFYDPFKLEILHGLGVV